VSTIIKENKLVREFLENLKRESKLDNLVDLLGLISREVRITLTFNTSIIRPLIIKGLADAIDEITKAFSAIALSLRTKVNKALVASVSVP
jgi:hypothetical protein